MEGNAKMCREKVQRDVQREEEQDKSFVLGC